MKVLTGKAEVMWAVNELSGMDFEIEEGWKTLRRFLRKVVFLWMS